MTYLRIRERHFAVTRPRIAMQLAHTRRRQFHIIEFCVGVCQVARIVVVDLERGHGQSHKLR